MLNSAWNWFVIILTIANILACWWLLFWTNKVGPSDADEDGTTGHVWDGDLKEMNNPLPRWWLMLFHITIVFSLAYLALYPGLGNFDGYLKWTQLQQYEAEMTDHNEQTAAYFSRFEGLRGEQLITNADALAVGQRTFLNHCAQCHGSDAGGAPGFPNLRDDDWLYGGDFNAIVTSIKNGRQGVMPPLGAALGETGVAEVVAYVQSLSGQRASPGLAQAGEPKYQAMCAVCHAADGSGNQALGAPNLTDDIWLYGSDPDTIADTINNGRNGNMPAHGPLIGAQRVPMVAAYVASLSREQE